MRCSQTRKCGKRFTLRRHPDEYVQRWRVDKCPSCGGSTYSDEPNRRNEMAKRFASGALCRCMPFPHDRGTVAGCVHWAGTGNAFEDSLAYEAVISTPRSST